MPAKLGKVNVKSGCKRAEIAAKPVFISRFKVFAGKKGVCNAFFGYIGYTVFSCGFGNSGAKL